MSSPDELHPPGISPWEVLGEDEVVFQGFGRVVRRPLRMPDGRELGWDMMDLPDTVAVFALTPEQRVVLVRQYRPGPARLLTSLPGGFVDPHETPVEAAARELREETGYVAAELVYLTSTRAVSATNVQHVVAALNCEPGGEIRFDEFEECEVVIAELADFRSWLRDHPMGSREHSYLALDLLGLL